MRRIATVFLPLLGLSACATLVTGQPGPQQVLVAQRAIEAAYLRAQAVAVGLGLQIVRTQDQPHLHGRNGPRPARKSPSPLRPRGWAASSPSRGHRPMM